MIDGLMGNEGTNSSMSQCLRSDRNAHRRYSTNVLLKHRQFYSVPYHIQCGCCNIGMLTLQVMIAELMEHWGAEGLDSHLKSLQTVYKRRAQLMHNSAQQV